ncbi:MAG: hypothetical protein HY584_01465 [Candidatus Omnitrophica bacterium]|nr:hypothetical protein [Candidatus Omnitrophota bacterium]
MALPPQPHLPPRGGKEFQKALEHLGIRPLIFGLLWDRKKLYERIEHRMDHMFETGWIGEVKRLAKTGFSKTAKAAIGYHEILKYLQNRCTLTEAESEIKKRTRHLAKKQMTWFRADQRISWIPVSGNRFVSHALRKIVQEFTAS